MSWRITFLGQDRDGTKKAAARGIPKITAEGLEEFKTEAGFQVRLLPRDSIHPIPAAGHNWHPTPRASHRRFLYELGVTLEWEEVSFLARLGGWAERKGNCPGKIVLTRGLRRIADMQATRAFVRNYVEEHGTLPPKIAALLDETRPPEL